MDGERNAMDSARNATDGAWNAMDGTMGAVNPAPHVVANRNKAPSFHPPKQKII